MRAHASLRLGTLHGTTPELLASPWYCAWGFCMVWEAGSPTRRPLLPLNAGTAEPVRVSPPEAVAYLLELNVATAGGRETLSIELDRDRVGAMIPHHFGGDFRATPFSGSKGIDVGFGFL